MHSVIIGVLDSSLSLTITEPSKTTIKCFLLSSNIKNNFSPFIYQSHCVPKCNRKVEMLSDNNVPWISSCRIHKSRMHAIVSNFHDKKFHNTSKEFSGKFTADVFLRTLTSYYLFCKSLRASCSPGDWEISFWFLKRQNSESMRVKADCNEVKSK